MQRGHIWLSTSPEYEKEYLYKSEILHPLYSPETYELNIGTPAKNEDNLYNWYQNPEDIDDITSYLDAYKVITMQLHHRQPLYVDFDIEIDIVKYDLTKPKKTINKGVFDATRKFFEDQLEKFNIDYINSNLQRNLDIALTYQSGLGYQVKAQGVLFKNMKDTRFIVSDDGTSKIYNPTRIHATLSFPFENMYVAAGFQMDTDLLPRIDTTRFGHSHGKLKVNYHVFAGMTFSSPERSSDILYNNVKVGEYVVVNEEKVVKLWFDFASVGLENTVFGTEHSGKGDYAYFDIRYPFTTGYNQNIPFAGSSMPRLRKITFKNN